MPDVNPSEIGTWSQIALGAGVFIGGLIYSVSKLIKSSGKKDDDVLLTRGDSAELVRLAKENADLRAAQAEERLRREFDIKLQDVRADFSEVMRAGRESFYNKLNEVSAEVSEIKGMINARLPSSGHRR